MFPSEIFIKNLLEKKNWVQDAVSHPGSFHELAAKEGGLNREGNIKASFINKEMNSPNPKTRKRANLAATFKKFHK